MKLLPIILILLLILPVKAEILEVCPNPYNSKAEYVKVRCNSTCTLSDGEGEFNLSGGTHYVSKNATAFFKEFGFHPDSEFKGRFALSNENDEIYLYEGGKLVDSFRYKNPEKGLIYFRENGEWKTKFEGWTDFKPVSDYVEGEIILTPSNFVFNADTIVSYTFTTDRYVRGNYTLYLDSKPIGGIPVNEMEIAKRHETHFLNSKSYKFFHWKFGLKGDDVVVTTENWKWDNLGFIVHFKSHRISEYLREVLRHDEVYSSNPGEVCEPKGFRSLGGVGRTYKFKGNVTVFVLPDYNPIYDLMRGAKKELYVMAPYIGFKDTEFLKILRNKSCKVRVVVGREDCAKFLEDFGRRNGLNMEVWVDKRVHGKMVIADDRAVITSANFDYYGISRNREIGVLIEGKVVEDLKGLFDREKDFYVYPALLLLSLSVLAVYIYFKRLRAS